MYTNIYAFKSGLSLFSEQMSNNFFTHFPTLVTLRETRNKLLSIANHWIIYIKNSDLDFFILKNSKNYLIVSSPLSQVDAIVSQELQMELIDLHRDYVLEEKLKSLKLFDFYASISDTRFPKIRKWCKVFWCCLASHTFVNQRSA